MSQRIRVRRQSHSLDSYPPSPSSPSFPAYPYSPHRSSLKLPRSILRPRLMRATLILPLLILNAALLLALLVFPRPQSGRLRHHPMEEWRDLVDIDEPIRTRTSGLEIPTTDYYAGGTGREGCGYCGPKDTICREYGEHNLARSRAYEGMNTRLFRVLGRSVRGQPVKVGVLGYALLRLPLLLWYTEQNAGGR